MIGRSTRSAPARPIQKRHHPRLRELCGFLRTLALAALLALSILPAAAANPAGDATTAGPAAIVAAHPLAVAAGRAAIDAGGNAFDAAIAITAALGVVEPYGSGLGGGGFYLLQSSTGEAVFLDARETAPGHAHREMYLRDEDGSDEDSGDTTPRVDRARIINHPLGAGIPGIPAALQALEARATLPRRVLLEPAIQLAREGFKTDARYAQMAQFRADALRAGGDGFLLGGAAPAAGHRLVQADLATTLETLAREGFSHFYNGSFAAELAAAVREHGGGWTRDDLADYRVIEREPLRFHWRDLHVLSAPPPSSGGIAIAQTLGILERIAPDADATTLDAETGNPAVFHALIEALRLAYRDRALHLGDPNFIDHDPRRLLDAAYLDALAADIRLDQARPSAELLNSMSEPAFESPQTTHFAVADPFGNRVAATITLNLPFGSGFVVPGTGVLLNNEMDDFAAAPGIPNAYGLIGFEANAIAPGKRPLSSMSPTIVWNDAAVHLFGSPGGSRIITTVLQAMLAAQAGLPAEAIAARPRIHHQFLPDAVEFEPGAIDPHTRRALTSLGHTLQPKIRPWGDLGVIRIDRRDGSMTAAADPRAPSVAEVWWPPAR